MGDLLRIGQAAQLTGVTPDTLRYYERLGLLPRLTRTPAGYRQYPASVLNRLMLIRHAQAFGFSLREIARFLRVRESGGTPCQEVRAAAHRMRETVDRQIAELRTTRRRMDQVLRRWDRMLAETPPGRPARLLEALPATDPRNYLGPSWSRPKRSSTPSLR